MRFFFDTEFIEDGKTIDLISLGIVAEDGREFYAESSECDLDRANPWVRENVLVHLTKGDALMTRPQIARRVVDFVGAHRSTTKPQFWAYYASYDWVALCQLFGKMVELPVNWPMYVRDIKQLADSVGNPALPKQSGVEHCAIADARWTKRAYEFLASGRHR